MGKRKQPFGENTDNSKVARLSAFGFKTPTLNNQSSENSPIKPAEIASKTSSTRKFLESWKFGRPWLNYDREQKLMFCDICVRACVRNSFTLGCNIMKKECVVKHAQGTGENSHGAALQSLSEAETMTNTINKVISKNKSAVLAALRNVHFAANLNLANVVVPQLNALCISQGVSQLKDLQVDKHTTYEHHSSISDFQQSLAQVLESELVGKVRESGLFSVLVDESTDVSVHQNMVVYVRILEKVLGRVEARTHFLGIRQLVSATADSITQELVGLLEDKGLEVSKLVGVATDGASVMVGCRKGVVTQLKEICPGLVSVHCIAHRLALASGAAADRVRYLVKFQDILNSIFKYFQNSPKNMARLEAVQSVIEGMSSSRMKQVFNTRWLSFEGAVHSLVVNFPGVVSVLLEERSAKALALHKPITTFKFLYCAHFLADVLKHLSLLCKAYQGSEIDFMDVNPLLESTVEVIRSLRDKKSGEHLVKFLQVAPSEPGLDEDGLCTFEFQGHTVRDSVGQRSEAVSACEAFVSNVIGNLQERFTEKGDASILRSLGVFFDPSSCLDGVSDEVVSEVVQYLVRCSLGSETECRQEIVSFQAFIKVQIGSNSRVFGSSRDVCQVAVKNRVSFPICAAAAERLLVIPVSTVDCERGFSRQNIIKTDLRNSLSPESLDNLMRISIHSGDIDYEEAFNIWAAKKSRRILRQ